MSSASSLVIRDPSNFRPIAGYCCKKHAASHVVRVLGISVERYGYVRHKSNIYGASEHVEPNFALSRLVISPHLGNQL
jgi:hypothetical protein